MMATMKCPGCDNILETAVAQCPHCRLSLRRLDLKFGAVPLHTRYLTDRAELLPMTEVRKLRDQLRIFEKKFPQALFSVFIAELPVGNVREYAFWLANRARFNAIDATGGANFDLLLVIDVSSKSAALTIGYGLSGYLHEADLDDALTAAYPLFRDGQMSEGISACITWLTDRMRNLATKVRHQVTNEPQSAIVA